MADIFISYKAEDRRRIRPLVEALQADGYSVWWDEQIGGGTAWRQSIEAELNAAKCVIVVWSKRSVGAEGTFVQDEATRAQQRHVYVPVTVDKVHLPLGFGETQALPLTGWHGDRADPHYQAVLSAVRRNVGGRRRGSASPLRQAKVDRRTAIAGGAVAAVAVAGAGGWALFRSSPASASRSIAVLPFANLSGDPGQAYFSDGVAEEIRSALSRIAGLKVVGRTSSEAVRNDDTATAAKKLAVANILTGSVRQSPSTIRISAELIDGTTGMDRWSEDYDRAPGDAIKIQTDIAENVATALSSALGTAAKASINVGGTSDPKAQRLYLQVRAMWSGPPSKPAFQHAFQLLDSAIELDPKYADAIALKSLMLNAYSNNYADSPQELVRFRADSLALAQQALRIAPKLGLGHRALYGLYNSNLQMAPAYAEIKRAVDLSPGDADTLASYAHFTGEVLGQTQQGLRLSDDAIAADPLNPSSYDQRLSMLFAAGRFGPAVDYGKQLDERWPTQFGRAINIAGALMMLGRAQEAQAYLNAAPADYWARLTGEAILLFRAGDRAGGEAKLKQLQKGFGDAASYQYGEIYAQMGDKDRAFASLERAFAVKDAGLSTVRTDPFVEPLRSDPRFAALLKKMNFPAA